MVPAQDFHRILCTRPVEQNTLWARKLEQLKLDCRIVQAPLLELGEVTDEAQIHAIKQRLMDLDTYACIIFVSQNAINYGFEWIEHYWPQLPYGIDWLAIGKKTGELLQHRLGGLSQVHCATQLMTSEDLLSLDVLHDIADKKVLICRGLGGRPTIAEELTQRGASVELCELYERRSPDSAQSAYINLNLNKQDILPIFSGETLDNFHQLTKDLTSTEWQDTLLIVPSERVANIAENYGFKNIVTAKNANEESMLEAINKQLL